MKFHYFYFNLTAIQQLKVTWINSNRSLNDLGFDKDNESLCLYPIKEIIKVNI